MRRGLFWCRGYGTYGEDTMRLLRGPTQEVFLIGTAHISKQSVAQVHEVVRQTRPDCIVVELCRKRAERMMQQVHGQQAQDKSKHKMEQMISDMFAGFGKTPDWAFVLGKLMRLLYRRFENPGGEFKAALLDAEELKIPVVYGDQDVDVTLKKLSTVLSIQDLMNLMFRYTPNEKDMEIFQKFGSMDLSNEQYIEKFKTKESVTQLVSMMRRVLPKVAQVMIDERDLILAESIRKAPGQRIVAVVGMAHMDGIEKNYLKRT